MKNKNWISGDQFGNVFSWRRGGTIRKTVLILQKQEK